MSTKRSLGDRPGTAGGERLCEYIYVEGPVDTVLHFASPARPKDYLEYPIHTLKVGARAHCRVLPEDPLRSPANAGAGGSQNDRRLLIRRERRPSGQLTRML